VAPHEYTMQIEAKLYAHQFYQIRVKMSKHSKQLSIRTVLEFFIPVAPCKKS